MLNTHLSVSLCFHFRDEDAEKTDARRVALSLQQLSGAAANLQTLLNRTL